MRAGVQERCGKWMVQRISFGAFYGVCVCLNYVGDIEYVVRLVSLLLSTAVRFEW